MTLYILGQEIEIKGVDIAQTKQANDIASVETRQTNYTNSFSIPRTAKNIRTLSDLGIIGNDSNVPYQKNEAYLYADSGECLVYKGWAVFSDTTDNFKCNIYDGNLEIYKAIENKTLADLDLTDLQHSKTLAEVTSTFDDSKPYKYILADYNGKALYDTNKINIDYLIPSVKASWLIEAIELYTGFNLNGSYRTNPDFTNLYLTYPKGTPADLSTTLIFDYTTLPLVIGNGLIQIDPITFEAVEQISIKAIVNDSLTFTQNGDLVQHRSFPTVNGIRTFDDVIVLNTGDILSVSFEVYGIYDLQVGECWIEQIQLYDSLNIDFIDELKGLTIRDFLNEIVWRFGLTLFKNKYENVYNLKTVAERTNQTNAIDWTDKFHEDNGEKYIFGNYAQQNYFRYKYNDQNASYNDGSFLVNNQNLEDKKTVIQSKTFSPELSLSEVLGFTSKIYKLWDKTPKDDGTTTYKELSNRFYFIRSVNKSFESLAIGSESLTTNTTVTTAPVESFKGLNFQEIIIKNYSEMELLLDKSIVKNVSLKLKETDIVDLDLSIPYYFKQLGGSFILNKVSNYLPNKKTSCELVRINYSNNEIDFVPAHYSDIYYSSLHYSI